MKTLRVDKSGKVFRLTDIVTKEVSIVDHAANRRRFLVYKGDVKPEDTAPASPAGQALTDALALVVSAAEKFDAEDAPVAHVEQDLLVEVGKILQRLTGQSAESEVAKTETEGDQMPAEIKKNLRMMLHTIADQARSLAFAVETGEDLIDPVKLTEKIGEMEKMCSSLMEMYPAEKRIAPIGSVLEIVRQRAENVSAQLKASGKAVLEAATKDAAVLGKLFEGVRVPGELSDELLAVLTKSAAAGDHLAMETLFERRSYEIAKGALEGLVAALESASAPEAPAAPVVEAAPAPVVAAPVAEVPAAPVTPPPAAPTPDPAVEALKAQVAELTKRLATPAAPASRSETPELPAGEDQKYIFPENYNDPLYREALEKAGKRF